MEHSYEKIFKAGVFICRASPGAQDGVRLRRRLRTRLRLRLIFNLNHERSIMTDIYMMAARAFSVPVGNIGGAEY
jgi:hypothetical protein